MTDVHDGDALHDIEERIDAWLDGFYRDNAAIAAVERGDDAEHRWYVRLHGEHKEFTTVWLTLGQRTLRYEAYVMPAPEDQHALVYEFTLRRNEQLVGVHYAIGVEDAVFLRGELPLVALSEAELDRVIGSLYAAVERDFPTLIRLGYPRRFPI